MVEKRQGPRGNQRPGGNEEKIDFSWGKPFGPSLPQNDQGIRKGGGGGNPIDNETPQPRKEERDQ